MLPPRRRRPPVLPPTRADDEIPRAGAGPMVTGVLAVLAWLGSILLAMVVSVCLVLWLV
jgi:hypothetical protein